MEVNAAVDCQVLNRARDAELTSSEIELALRELAHLENGGQPPALYCRFSPLGLPEWRVIWTEHERHKWYRMAEDALWRLSTNCKR